ncbi:MULTISPECIES: acyl-CoA thioesterase II [unclassified Rothia (in: high G+C Gram-positive bacteria)]|uniref:acyl-CoA thioesterase n=1 Tax=unclassified Rothia (in: high G+C Gram-positive bacteria) TaxID=2689056 RepID=UPI00195607BC|nr:MULTISPECIES: acyl-CoA thioesterase II [unclassified Rothia (in: high G+C Gram-positive bacteria)]MBM7050874.1 acyl-CoA thioesterase II [Rothia sp. ZJ1223]QRZ62385.1 acyl-CoA thioesterase II [Rothia sp. ZJ932]
MSNHTAPTVDTALSTMLTLETTQSTGHDDAAFSAQTLARETPRVYGGQVLAQSLMAASATVEEDRPVHSLHAYFLQAGSIDKPLSYGVQKLGDTRSFSTRRVHAYQEDTPIFSTIMSFQEPARGLEHAVTMPKDVPNPESLPTAAQILAGIEHPMVQAVAHERPFDLRHVSTPLYLGSETSPSTTNMVWIKAIAPLGSRQVAHRAALAYASDYTIMEPIMRAHGKFWLQPGMKVASLDHSIWFHDDVAADDWLLFAYESPAARGGRGLTTGSVFTRDGRHVATIAQEALLRLPEFK